MSIYCISNCCYSSNNYILASEIDQSIQPNNSGYFSAVECQYETKNTFADFSIQLVHCVKSIDNGNKLQMPVMKKTPGLQGLLG